ncbi:MAG TPA: hypothetical protein VHE34_24120 [Puia sp.]|uniref:hypothetical protein n=1 Tax=Puia sp. TaxID=2045100 RepID=UPI002CEE2D68|nr:hypothetical protein [Puia sp.]HVU98341.1 hypothetical protein [Puia sp.]
MITTLGIQLSRAEMRNLKGGCSNPPCTYVWWTCDNCYIACYVDNPPVEQIPGCDGESTNCVRTTNTCSNPNYIACC